MSMMKPCGATLVSLLLCLSLSGCSALAVKEQLDQRQLQQAHFTQSELKLTEGGQLRYWIGGQGEPLVMLHGFGGTATTTWLAMMLQLSQHYRIIAPDLAWFGDSYSDGPANITTQRQAVEQLLAQLRVEQYYLLGISYGGFVSYDMMLKSQGVKKAVLLSSPGTFISDQQLQALSQRFEREQPADIFVPEDRKQMRQLLSRVFSHFPPLPHAIDEQIYQRYFAPWQQQKRQLITSLPAYRDQLLAEQKCKVLPQSLVIWGENDMVFSLEQGKQLAQHLDAPMLIIDDAPHNISNEYPQLISQTVRLFLN